MKATYFGMIGKATNTDSAYENAVDKIIKRKDMLHGKPIHLVFQDEDDLLDLTEHRFEIKVIWNKDQKHEMKI